MQLLKGRVFADCRTNVPLEEETESTVITELKNLDLYNMTPMEVMMAVAELKKKL